MPVQLVKMPRQYQKVPDQYWHHVVSAWQDSKSWSNLSSCLRIPWSTVDNIIQCYSETNQIEATPYQGGCPSCQKLNDTHQQHLLSYIAAHANATIEEIRNNLINSFNGLEVSAATVEQELWERAGFNLQTSHGFGQAPAGERAKLHSQPSLRACNVSVMVAADQPGIRAHKIRFGTWNANVFAQFITNNLSPALGESPEGTMHDVVLDDAPFHQSKIV
ncbi:hypothetical protein BCV70DRAFT_206883 [Testicularia cyperi]|uniref:Tc1-like transposase DDE domain-containing protein n=1 Tax=Testicularia cyperi TaxID=1882483 RepID=A0A317XPE9_9BASI|nr:hypothetical protein BCV70DRAFT_206883 [Testicularia cyperi]